MKQDQAICRVCRMGHSSSQPLFHPCRCCGSIKYVHQDCLIEWLSHSKKKYCEVCEYAFVFTPIYREDMPSRIPIYLLLQTGIKQFMSVFVYMIRCILALFIWLVLLPTLTLWAWRFYVWGITSFGKPILNKELPLDLSTCIIQYLTRKRLLDDCFHGLTMTIAVITFAVAVYLFKEWIVKNTTTLENRDTELTHRRRPSRVNRSILQDQEQLRLRLEQLSRELESRNTNSNIQQRRRSSFDMPNVSDDLFTVMSAPTGAQSPFAAWRDYQQQATGSSLSQTRTWRAREFTTTTHIAEREDYFGEQVARHQEERREQIVNDDEEENGNEDDDEEDQTFDLRENRDKILEAVGLHGSPFNLIKNPILMSLMINLCLGITIWIPYIIGKAVASVFPLNTLKNVAYQFTDIVYQTPLVRTISSHPFLSNYLSYDMYHLCSLLYQYVSEHEKIRIALYVSTGYLILISIGFWYLHHNRTLVGRTVLRQQTVFFKVLLFILLELVLFPIVCGFFLDLSTLPFFKECSLMDRVEFVQHNPYSSIFLHWFVGTGFIYKFSVFISHVREVVRPGVLWFIRDPSDPQFHPVQEMVEQPILSLFKRFMSNAATYFMLIMVGMGLVSLLICRYTSIPPIVWTFSTPLSTLPFDLLAIQFILPRVMEYIVPGEFSKKAVMTWWHIVARPLRLSSFMFGEIGPETPTNGYLAQVPAYDHVPYVRHRSMVVPVDPQSLIPLDETDRLLGHPAGSGVGQTMIVYIPSFFKLRVAVFLLLVWITGSILVCSMSFVPLLLGRHIFVQLLNIQGTVHDVYSFAVGACIMIFLSSLLNTALQKCALLHQHQYIIDKSIVKHYFLRKIRKMARYGYLFSVVGVIIPLLIGCMLDLYVFIPIKLSGIQVDAIDLYIFQDWAIGVASMTLVSGLIGIFSHNTFRSAWIDMEGHDIDLFKASKKVFIPIIALLVYVNAIPSLLIFGIIYVFAIDDPWVRVLIFRCAYPVLFCLAFCIALCIVCMKLVKMWICKIKDDTYLVDKLLHNVE